MSECKPERVSNDQFTVLNMSKFRHVFTTVKPRKSTTRLTRPTTCKCNVVHSNWPADQWPQMQPMSGQEIVESLMSRNADNKRQTRQLADLRWRWFLKGTVEVAIWGRRSRFCLPLRNASTFGSRRKTTGNSLSSGIAPSRCPFLKYLKVLMGLAPILLLKPATGDTGFR